MDSTKETLKRPTKEDFQASKKENEAALTIKTTFDNKQWASTPTNNNITTFVVW